MMQVRHICNYDEVIKAAIPIYTRKHPNPKSGREDCRITTREKERFRAIMKTRLIVAQSEAEVNKIIDHYKQLFSEQPRQ